MLKQTDLKLIELAEYFRKRLKHARLANDWHKIELLEMECSQATQKIRAGVEGANGQS